MNITTARKLLREPIDQMDLTALQRHRVRLLDAWRESKAQYGYAQAVHDGFYKILESDSASGYVPADFWLTHNLDYRIKEVQERENALLQEGTFEPAKTELTPEEFASLYATERITGYLIDVYNETAQVVTVEKELSSYYRILDCSLIAITEHRIGVPTPRNREPRTFTVVSDDESLLVESPKISAIDNMGSPMLCGNLFIVKSSVKPMGEVELAGLEPEDIEYLKRFISPQGTHKYPKPYPMLHQCEYL